jgi:hypothetical protein
MLYSLMLRRAELPMKPRLSIAFGTGVIGLWIVAPSASNGGSCSHNSNLHNCFQLPARLDFSSVPEVPNEIVGGEPNLRLPQTLKDDPRPASTPYTGPMIGVNSRVGGPTVGYYWSIQ